MPKSNASAIIFYISIFLSSVVFANEESAREIKSKILEDIGMKEINGERGEYWVDLAALLSSMLAQEGELDKIKRERAEAEANRKKIESWIDEIRAKRDEINECEKIWELTRWEGRFHPLNVMNARLNEVNTWSLTALDFIRNREEELGDWMDADEHAAVCAFIDWIYGNGAGVPAFIQGGGDGLKNRVKNGLLSAGFTSPEVEREAGAERARVWLSGRALYDKESPRLKCFNANASESLNEACTAARYLTKLINNPDFKKNLSCQEAAVANNLSLTVLSVLEGIGKMLGFKVSALPMSPATHSGVF